METSRPLMCTLSAAEMGDRRSAWAKVFNSGLVTRESIPGGIAFHAAPDAAEALISLIDLERECCAWIDFEVLKDDSSGEATINLTADGDGRAVLSGMFLAAGR